MKLKDKVCVVTGAAAGIGRAIAAEFRKEGAIVIPVDVNPCDPPGSLVDVSDPTEVEELANEITTAYGRVDVLVNNAAIQVSKLVEDTKYEEWNRQMSVNIGGVFLCTRAFLTHLRTTRGAIVNLSSVNGFFVEPMCAGYCATKAAIIAFTKAVAIDHGREGIRCNCICPGYIDAGLAEAYFHAQSDPAVARASAGKLHALGRIGRPEEVARTAVFLASNDASFVTGSMLVVDGGFGSGLPPGDAA